MSHLLKYSSATAIFLSCWSVLTLWESEQTLHPSDSTISRCLFLSSSVTMSQSASDEVEPDLGPSSEEPDSVGLEQLAFWSQRLVSSLSTLNLTCGEGAVVKSVDKLDFINHMGSSAARMWWNRSLVTFAPVPNDEQSVCFWTAGDKHSFSGEDIEWTISIGTAWFFIVEFSSNHMVRQLGCETHSDRFLQSSLARHTSFIWCTVVFALLAADSHLSSLTPHVFPQQMLASHELSGPLLPFCSILSAVCDLFWKNNKITMFYFPHCCSHSNTYKMSAYNTKW